MTVGRATLPVSLNGTKYSIDVGEYRRQPVDSIRAAVDQALESGEQSLTQVGIWKRTGDDFVLGAGQTWFDRTEESSRRRFSTSKGIDPWTLGQLSLLQEVERKASGATDDTTARSTHATGQAVPGQWLIPIGLYLVWVRGNTISWATDPYTNNATGAWTAVTYAGGDIIAACTDGYQLYVSDGADVYAFSAGFGTAMAVISTENAALLAVCAGRLLAAHGRELFEISADGQKQTIHTHQSVGWLWSAITAAPNGIYAAGYSLRRSEVYLIAVDEANGALGAPVPAATMPDGEDIRAMCYYGGVLVLAGSSVSTAGLGGMIRLAAIGGGGFLSYGPKITFANRVECLEPQGEYVWFEWHNYDATSTGLGRLSLSRFTADLVPAYASDILTLDSSTVQGDVVAIATFQQRRFFVVSGVGLFGERYGYKVASGTYESGRICFGTPETKRFKSIEVRTDALNGGSEQVTVAWLTETGTTKAVGTHTGSGGRRYKADITDTPEEEWGQVKLTLTRGSTYPALSPVVQRWTLRAIPMPNRVEEIYLPIVLAPEVNHFPQAVGLNVATEFLALKALMTSRSPVTLIMGAETCTVVVDGLFYGQTEAGKPQRWTPDQQWIEGIILVKLLTVDDA